MAAKGHSRKMASAIAYRRLARKEQVANGSSRLYEHYMGLADRLMRADEREKERAAQRVAAEAAYRAKRQSK